MCGEATQSPHRLVCNRRGLSAAVGTADGEVLTFAAGYGSRCQRRDTVSPGSRNPLRTRSVKSYLLTLAEQLGYKGDGDEIAPIESCEERCGSLKQRRYERCRQGCKKGRKGGRQVHRERCQEDSERIEVSNTAATGSQPGGAPQPGRRSSRSRSRKDRSMTELWRDNGGRLPIKSITREDCGDRSRQESVAVSTGSLIGAESNDEKERQTNEKYTKNNVNHSHDSLLLWRAPLRKRLQPTTTARPTSDTTRHRQRHAICGQGKSK